MPEKTGQDAASASSAHPPLRTGHPYFMYDNIHDMARVLGVCLSDDMLRRVRGVAETIVRRGTKKVFLVGCGTSLNIGKALVPCVEQKAGIPAGASDSLEFMLYPSPDLDAKAAVIAISHSGNSRVTVQAAEFARQHGAYTLCMVGDPQGKLVQAGDVALLDPGGVEHNGPKIRSYIVSCFQGLLLCLMIQEIKTGVSLIPQLAGLPEAAAQFIRDVEPRAKQVAGEWAKQVQSYMVAGSGSDAGNAVEIALKILETIPTPANGFDVEEYTHGPILSTKTDRALIVLQGTPEGQKRCVQAAYAASAVTDKIMVVTADAQAGWPTNAVVWQIPAGFGSAGFVLSPMPAQILVYYLCLALGTNPDHASTASPQMTELYHRAFPPGMH
jgi:fructoselysine-6-P-deglycase FrlB-like protein